MSSEKAAEILRIWAARRDWTDKRIVALEQALLVLIDAVESHDNIYDEGLSSHHEAMEAARAVLSRAAADVNTTSLVTHQTIPSVPNGADSGVVETRHWVTDAITGLHGFWLEEPPSTNAVDPSAQPRERGPRATEASDLSSSAGVAARPAPQDTIEHHESRSPDGDGLGTTRPNTASDSAHSGELPMTQGAAKPSGQTTAAQAERKSPKAGAGSEPADSQPPSFDAVGQPTDTPICPRANKDLDLSSSAGIAARPALARPPEPFNEREHCRTQVREALARHGYAPNELQLKFRDGFWDRDLAELAICDALNEQGSIPAHPGDGVGCVAQMIEAHVLKAAALARPAWQPIETAPYDFTRVLVWSKALNEPHIAYWTGLVWADAEGDWDLREDEWPTHWQALPPPPTENL